MERSISSNIAKHMYEVFHGGNWTTTNFKDLLSEVSLEEAQHEIEGYNSILALSYHIFYFIREVNKVLGGDDLKAHDKYSFDHPEINTEEEWREYLNEILLTAQIISERIKELPDEVLTDDFVDPKYGNTFRNLIGLIEHTHYHLGQIVIIRKMILAQNQQTRPPAK